MRAESMKKIDMTDMQGSPCERIIPCRLKFPCPLKSSVERLLAFVGLLAGFLLLCANNLHEDLWYDEAYSLAMTRHGFGEIAVITAGDSHPPLYYWLLKVFLGAFHRVASLFAPQAPLVTCTGAGGAMPAERMAGGAVGGMSDTLASVLSDASAARIFSAFAILLLAVLAAGPVRRLLGARTAWLYGVLVFTTPMAFAFAREVRMYAWAAFFATAFALYGLLAMRDGRVRDWIAFAAFGLCAALVHYYALLAAAVVGMLLAARALWTPAGRRRLPMLLACGAAILAAYLPWLRMMGSQLSRMPDYWITEVSLRLFVQTATYTYNRPFVEAWLPLLPIWLIALALVLTGAGWLGRKAAGGEARFLAVSWLAVFLAALLVTLLVRPMIVPRYLFCTVGLWLIPCAHGLAVVRNRRMATAAFALLLAASAFQLGAMQMTRVNGPVREAATAMTASDFAGEPILYTDGTAYGVFSVYLPQTSQYLLQPEGSRWFSNYDAFLPNGTHGADPSAVLQGRRSVWIAVRVNADGKPVHEGEEALLALPADAEGSWTLPDSWFGVVFRHVEADALRVWMDGER